MPEDYTTHPMMPARSSGPSLKLVVGLALLAFVGGAALTGYLVWDNKLLLSVNSAAEPARVLTSIPASAQPPAATTQTAGTALPATAAQTGQEARLGQIEQRLARIDLQAAAIEGNTARAEALLIAFAARRAIEKGAPLGYLADQLKLRFGDAQPAAVQTVIAAAQQPVTLDLLSGQLDTMATNLTRAPQNESGWARIKREMSSLFVIRHDDRPSSRPEERLDRAKLMLRTGQVEAAIAEVSQLPGSGAFAQSWMAAANRYAGAQRSLDLIETTALLAADKLRTASGQPVRQASPAGPVVTPPPVSANSF